VLGVVLSTRVGRYVVVANCWDAEGGKVGGNRGKGG